MLRTEIIYIQFNVMLRHYYIVDTWDYSLNENFADKGTLLTRCGVAVASLQQSTAQSGVRVELARALIRREVRAGHEF